MLLEAGEVVPGKAAKKGFRFVLQASSTSVRNKIGLNQSFGLYIVLARAGIGKGVWDYLCVNV